MQVVKTKGEVGPDGRLRLDGLGARDSGLGVREEHSTTPAVTSPNRSKYDFADVVGKLQWQGDALEEQRRLRN